MVYVARDASAIAGRSFAKRSARNTAPKALSAMTGLGGNASKNTRP
jgi:hypothetical protein